MMSKTEDLTYLPREWLTSLSDPCSRGHCAGCRYSRCGHGCHNDPDPASTSAGVISTPKEAQCQGR